MEHAREALVPEVVFETRNPQKRPRAPPTRVRRPLKIDYRKRERDLIGVREFGVKSEQVRANLVHRNDVLVLMHGAQSNCAAGSFLRRDGDNALLTRVVRFLVSARIAYDYNWAHKDYSGQNAGAFYTLPRPVLDLEWKGHREAEERRKAAAWGLTFRIGRRYELGPDGMYEYDAPWGHSISSIAHRR